MDRKTIIFCPEYNRGEANCELCSKIEDCAIHAALERSESMSGTISDTLSARGERYGNYPEQCRITQNIKRAMIDSPNWETLSDDKKEALEMTALKIGRILNGDPEYADSWHDIAGYAKLVEDTLNV